MYQMFHKFTYLQILILIFQDCHIKTNIRFVHFPSIKFYNIPRKNINSSFEYMITHYHFLVTRRKKIIIFRQFYITRRCYCLYHNIDCYSCTHTQKNIILVLKKLFNLSFLLFKKIFFKDNRYLLKEKR